MLEIREEELNMVAGGDISETFDDSRFLYKAEKMNRKLNMYDFILDWNDCSKAVDRAWSLAGVTSVTHPLKKNEYIYEQQLITRDQALSLLK